MASLVEGLSPLAQSRLKLIRPDLFSPAQEQAPAPPVEYPGVSPAVAQYMAGPQEPAAQPEIPQGGFGDFISSLGAGARGFVPRFKATVEGIKTAGGDPAEEAKRVVASDEFKRLRQSQDENQVADKQLIPGVTTRGVQGVFDSLATTAAITPAAIGTGLASTAILDATGVGAVPGTLLGLAASIPVSYKLSANANRTDTINNIYTAAREKYKQESGGEELTPEQFGQLMTDPEVQKQVQKSAMAEGGFEAISNLIAGGALKQFIKPIAGKLVKSSVSNIIKDEAIGNMAKKASKFGAVKLAAEIGAGELIPEAATNIVQDQANIALGLQQGPAPSLTSPSDWAQALKDVALPVIATAGIAGGVAKTVSLPMDALGNKIVSGRIQELVEAGGIQHLNDKQLGVLKDKADEVFQARPKDEGLANSVKTINEAMAARSASPDQASAANPPQTPAQGIVDDLSSTAANTTFTDPNAQEIANRIEGGAIDTTKSSLIESLSRRLAEKNIQSDVHGDTSLILSALEGIRKSPSKLSAGLPIAHQELQNLGYTEDESNQLLSRFIPAQVESSAVEQGQPVGETSSSPSAAETDSATVVENDNQSREVPPPAKIDENINSGIAGAPSSEITLPEVTSQSQTISATAQAGKTESDAAVENASNNADATKQAPVDAPVIPVADVVPTEIPIKTPTKGDIAKQKNAEKKAAAIAEQSTSEQAIPKVDEATIPSDQTTTLARLATAKEKNGGIAQRRGYDSIPEKAGHEVVYKPYGEQGAGYYYSKQEVTASSASPSPKVVSQSQQEQVKPNITQKPIPSAREVMDKANEEPDTGVLPKGLTDRRFLKESYRSAVQSLSNSLVPGGGIAHIKDEHDRIIGRTSSVNPMWFQDFKEVFPSVKAVDKAVKKALEGKTLGKSEARIITGLMNAYDSEIADSIQEYGNPNDYRVMYEEERDAMGDIGSTPGEFIIAKLYNKALDSGIPENEIVSVIGSHRDDYAGAITALEGKIDEARSETASQYQEHSDAVSGQNQDYGQEATGVREEKAFTLANENDGVTPPKSKPDKSDVEAENRRKADSEAKDFRLSGSNRPADIAIAGGQKDLLSIGGESNSTSGEDSLTENKPTGPMSVSMVNKELARIKGKLGLSKAIRFQIPATEADLPEDVLRRVEQRNARGRVNGIHDNGTIYIIANRMKSKVDLERVILHEITHYGAKSLFGRAKQAAYSLLWNKLGGRSGINKLSDSYGVDIRSYIQRADDLYTSGQVTESQRDSHLMDEFLARYNERRAAESWPKQAFRNVQEFFGSIRDAMRRSGLIELSKISNSDLAYLMKSLNDSASGKESNAPRFLMEGDVLGLMPQSREDVTKDGMAFSLIGNDDPQGPHKGLANVSGVLGWAENNFDKIIGSVKGDNAYKAILKASSMNNIVSKIAKNVQPDVQKFSDAVDLRKAYTKGQTDITEQVHSEVSRYFNKFPRGKQRDMARNRAETVLSELSQLNIDPTKPFSEHTWLHNKSAGPNIEKRFNRVVESYKQFIQDPDAKKVYGLLNIASKTQLYTETVVNTHAIIEASSALSDKFGVNKNSKDPMAAFFEHLDEIPTQEKAFAYWSEQQKEYGRKLQTIVDQIAEKRDKSIKIAKKIDPEFRASELKHTPEELSFIELNDLFKSKIERSDQGFYSHSGRYGTRYVSANLNVENQQAWRIVKDAFSRAGLSTPGLMPDMDDGRLVLRYENQDQAAEAFNTLQRLFSEKQGVLKEAPSGGRVSEIDSNPPALPSFVNQVLMDVGAKISNEEDKTDILNRLHDFVTKTYQDLRAGAGTADFRQRKEGIAGYSADILRNFAVRSNSSARQTARRAVAGKIDGAFIGMTKRIADLSRPSGDKPADPEMAAKARMIMDEVKIRNGQFDNPIPSTGLDKFRAVGHSYWLAFSNSYLIGNVIGGLSNAHAELAARFNQVKTIKAMVSTQGATFKVLNAIRAEGWEQGGMMGIFSAPINVNKMDFLSAEQKHALRRVIASGHLSATQANEQARLASGDTSSSAELSNILSAYGHYSELGVRILTFLSAYQLKKEQNATRIPGPDGIEDAIRFGIKMIKDTQFGYSPEDIARGTGKQGYFGTVTPLVFGFKQFSFQYLEKLGRDAIDAVSGPEHVDVNDPTFQKTRTEARKAVLNMYVNSALIAGTLGLPGIGLAIALANKLHDLFDPDEPLDAKAELSKWLHSIMPERLADAATHGIPFASGVSVQSNVGLENILPFTQFLSDRREFRDALESYALQSVGPAANAAAGVIIGAGKAATGDLRGGMKMGLPPALKSVGKAIDLELNGYVDAQGNRTAVDVNAWSLMSQALGYTPRDVRKYEEKSSAIKTQSMLLDARARVIRDNIVRAVESKDEKSLNKWLDSAQSYMIKNPLQPALLQSIAPALKNRAKQRAISSATGLPITQSPREAIRALKEGR